MIFGLLYFCVVILCVNRSRSSFILYRIVKHHSRQSNVRRIWTCADNGVFTIYGHGGHIGQVTSIMLLNFQFHVPKSLHTKFG